MGSPLVFLSALDARGARTIGPDRIEPVKLSDLPRIVYYATLEFEECGPGRALEAIREDWYAGIGYLGLKVLREWNLSTDYPCADCPREAEPELFEEIPLELILQLSTGNAHVGMIVDYKGEKAVVTAGSFDDGKLIRRPGPIHYLSLVAAGSFDLDESILREILSILNESGSPAYANA